MSATVLEPGFTSLQSLGKAGHGGAMDPWSLRAANQLCGNDESTPAMEFTLAGPTLRFEEDSIAAICGSEFGSTLDGEPVPRWESFRVPASSTLTVGKAMRGARGYLAYAAGDGPLRKMTVPPESTGALRVVEGPQRGWTDDDPCAPSFVVSPRSDRVGVRLAGPALHRRKDEIDPEPTVTGAVQLPPDGHPIVLGPDRGTTGGYPVIAVVIAADCGWLAHLRPGDTLRFATVSIADARQAWRARERALEEGITEWI